MIDASQLSDRISIKSRLVVVNHGQETKRIKYHIEKLHHTQNLETTFQDWSLRPHVKTGL